MKLIDKDALVAEIEKLRKNAWESFQKGNSTEEQYYLRYGVIQDVLSFLDTLEVKEVDLEKEIDRVWDNTSDKFLEDGWKEFEDIAKHFFELGLSASNTITAADRGTAEEIIINLKRVEKDYRIDLTREIEWLRNKVKKGE